MSWYISVLDSEGNEIDRSPEMPDVETQKDAIHTMEYQLGMESVVQALFLQAGLPNAWTEKQIEDQAAAATRVHEELLTEITVTNGRGTETYKLVQEN